MADVNFRSFHLAILAAAGAALLVIFGWEFVEHFLLANFGGLTHSWLDLAEGAVLTFFPTVAVFIFFAHRWHSEREATLKNLRALNQKLRELAVTDGLTGVANHRYFQMTLEREWQRMLRHGHMLTCVMLDVDNFKKFNDEHGHPAGDAVLAAVGRVLKAEFREIDTVTRYGGEEFAMLLAEKPGHLLGLQKVLERIRACIAEAEINWHGERLHITASLGAAMVPSPLITTPDKLVQAADKALYVAKKAGKNRFEIFGVKREELAKPSAVPVAPKAKKSSRQSR